MQNQLDLAPVEEREILEQIRNDHELVDRLRITPQEIETLEKCALLGTLASKHDMLFILRQIREAGGPSIDVPTVIAQPPPPADEADEDTVPPLIRVATPAQSAMREPGSLEGIVRRRVPEQLGVMFWVIILVVGLAWNAVTLMVRWRDSFSVAIGTTAAQASGSDAAYGNLDHFNVLLWSEILFVVGIAVTMFVIRRRRTSRFKVRPGRRYR